MKIAWHKIYIYKEKECKVDCSYISFTLFVFINSNHLHPIQELQIYVSPFGSFSILEESARFDLIAQD